MSAQGDSIGMMEGAFFVSRNEILAWANDLLKLTLTRIEQCATGAVHCQIMDAIYPGKVNLAKVNWRAKHEYEFVNNFKVLQQIFLKMKIQKHIEVEKLIKAKYQDNLEFMQWLKRYFDLNYGGQEYDALERRKGADLFKIIGGGNAPTGASVKSATLASKSGVSSSLTSGASRARKSSSSATGGATTAAKGGVDSKDHEKLKNEVAELKLTVNVLEREKDFYFGKLREIEILCQNYRNPELDVVQMVQKILYATEDEVVQIDPEGNLVITDSKGEKIEETKASELKSTTQASTDAENTTEDTGNTGGADEDAEME